MKHIAIVVEALNYHSGARAPIEIAKHLAKRGYSITLISYQTKQTKDAIDDLKKTPIQIELISNHNFLTSISAIYNKIQASHFDCICFAGTLPFFIGSKLSGLPIILMYHGTQPNAYLERLLPNKKPGLYDVCINFIGNIYIFLNNFILVTFSTRIVAISKFAADELYRYYKRKCDEIIYLGATNFIKSKKEYKSQNKIINLLSVSRITPYKGFHILIKQLKEIKRKNIFLTIVGPVSQQKYYEYLKKIKDKNTKIITDISDSALADIYKQTDIYLSADTYLYFGLPILEAAFFSIPTISFNKAAASELIKNKKTGLVANNSQEFKNYIIKLIDNPQLKNKMGQEAEKLAQNFSWARCAYKWEKEIEKVVIK